METQDLELRLGSYQLSSSETTDYICNSEVDRRRRQELSIFYDDGVCASDISGHQARAIIDMAKEAAAGPQTLSPGLPTKRSLQRFLQKRKARMALLPSS